MSRGKKPIWQQKEQLTGGGKTKDRVLFYVEMWEERCYRYGIPDEIPPLLEKTGRAPSYKSIAMAILNNDMKLSSLGFSRESKEWADNIYWNKRRMDENAYCGQEDLFD